MGISINTIYEHEGTKFHLQAEDLETAAKTFEIRVYDKGSVVWMKRVSYAELDAQEQAKAERDRALRAMMNKMLLTVEAAIGKGKIG